MVVVGERVAHRLDARTKVHGDAFASLGLAPFQPFAVRFLAGAEANQVRVVPVGDQLGEFAHVGADRQVGVIDPAELVGVGVDVDQRLAGMVGRDERVAVGGRLAEPRADGKDQVRVAHPLPQLGIGAVAELAGIDRALVVDRILAAESGGDRDSMPVGEDRRNDARRAGSSRRRRRWRPDWWRPSAARTAPGPLRDRALRRRGGTRGRSSARPRRAACPRVARARPGRGGRRSRRDKRGRHIRGCAGHRRSVPPIWRWGRRKRGSRSPGSPRGPVAARDIADEQDHRRRSPGMRHGRRRWHWSRRGRA